MLPEWGEVRQAVRAAVPRQPDSRRARSGLRPPLLAVYSGAFEGLPRVRYWQIWNEPNLLCFSARRSRAGGSFPAKNYRAMVNAVTPAIHAVHRDNVGDRRWHGSVRLGTGGLPADAAARSSAREPRLARAAACTPQPSAAHARGSSVWAHHPTPAGNPSHHAPGRDNISIPDLPQVQRLLGASWAAHHIVAARRITVVGDRVQLGHEAARPEGRTGAPAGAVGVEGLYRMWSVGVSVVTWFQLQDDPMSESELPVRLYFVSGRAKPALRAFRFPFVALPASKRRIDLGANADEQARVCRRPADARWPLEARSEAHGEPLRHLPRASSLAVSRGRLRARSPPATPRCPSPSRRRRTTRSTTPSAGRQRVGSQDASA